MRCVVAIRFSSLGDIVLTLPALAHLRALSGSVQIIYATRARFASLLHFSPLADTVLALSDRCTIMDLSYRLRLEAPGVVLDFHNNLRSRMVTTALGGVPVFRTPSTHLARLRLLVHPWTEKTVDNRRIEPVWRQHAGTVDRWVAWTTGRTGGFEKPTDPAPLLQPAISGESYPGGPLRLLEPTDQGRAWAAAHLPERVPAVALLPGARHANKRWPAVQFRRLAGRLEAAGCLPVVLGDRGEASLMSFVAGGAEHACLIPPDWDSMLASLARCAVAVGNDSGLSHVAEALGVPVVWLFGPTIPEFGFGPRHPRSMVLQRPLRCRPCTLHGRPDCPAGHHRCLEEIPGIEVAECVRMLFGNGRTI